MSYYVKVRGVLKALVPTRTFLFLRHSEKGKKRLIQALIGNFLWLFFSLIDSWEKRKKERLNMRSLSRSRGTEGGEKERETMLLRNERKREREKERLRKVLPRG